jgi:hypothetical protein
METNPNGNKTLLFNHVNGDKPEEKGTIETREPRKAKIE